MNIILHPAAEKEFSFAFHWYEKQMKGLGSEFSKAIDDTINKIKTSPLSFPVCYKTLRKAIIMKFPYIILFNIVQPNIRIIAIFHTSRSPLEWNTRK